MKQLIDYLRANLCAAGPATVPRPCLKLHGRPARHHQAAGGRATTWSTTACADAGRSSAPTPTSWRRADTLISAPAPRPPTRLPCR